MNSEPGALNRVIAYIDGGARGNPGPAGYGVRVEQSDGTLVEEFHESIGVATNNVAEYRGLIAALEWARRHDCPALLVRSDSLLLVQQMRGNLRRRAPGAAATFMRIRLLALEIGWRSTSTSVKSPQRRQCRSVCERYWRDDAEFDDRRAKASSAPAPSRR